MKDKNQEARKWVRHGDCNHCGWCCKFSFDPVMMFFPNPDERRAEFLKVRGFWEASEGRDKGLAAWGQVYLRCQYHTDDNKCVIFDKPERPRMCHDFPETPQQVKNTPCSYWFEDSEGNTIGGDGSPYPGESK